MQPRYYSKCHSFKEIYQTEWFSQCNVYTYHLETLENKDSDYVGLGLVQRVCISNKFPSDADVASLGTTLAGASGWKPLESNGSQSWIHI